MEEIIYKVFALLDKNKCIIDIWSTGNQAVGDKRTEQEMIENGYVLIDSGSDGLIYGYAQVNYLEKKHGKPMCDERMIPNFKHVDSTVKELEENDKEEWFIKPMAIEAEKEKQQNMLEDMMRQAQQVSFLVELPDEQAATIHYCYEPWKNYIGKPLTKLNEQGKENRIEYDGKLWKVRNDIPVVLENQPPSIETASLYERIDVEHAGTIDDPIPYDQTMTVYKDKYYIEDGIKYLCIRDSGQPLYATCASLVGNYFELIE